MTFETRQAYSEVCAVLEYMPDEYVKKIPEKIIKLFQSEKLEDYEVNINKSNPLDKNYLSKTGKTYAIDFMIGNEEFAGKHLSSITLRTFIEQYSDEEADRFIIDPEFDNDIAFKC